MPAAAANLSPWALTVLAEVNRRGRSSGNDRAPVLELEAAGLVRITGRRVMHDSELGEYDAWTCARA